MRFQALGPLAVVDDEGPVPLRPAQRRLMATMLINRERKVSPDLLVDWMWGESPPGNARNSLHVHLSALRRTLPGVIQSAGDGYMTDLSGHEFDVLTFTDLATDSSRQLDEGRFGEAAELAAGATRLWRAEPYPELVDIESARSERHRLTELLVTARSTHARALVFQGRIAESISVLRQLVVDQPLNEVFWEELILAYYLAGRQAEALAAYQEAKRTLGEALGIEPGPRLRLLEDRILLQDRTLIDDAADTVPNNLPALDSSFVGRDEDLRAVERLLGENRLVTVTGAPGIGKTRLAFELGRSALSRFPAGVWVARLGGARTEPDVLAAIASAMRVVERSEDLVSLFREVSARPALLILDNCEQVAPSVRQFLGGRSHGDRLKILATSRTRLGVGDEVVWPLSELAVPASVADLWQSPALQLFADRVRAIDPTTDLEGVDPNDLITVCRKTGGIPLALELVARWVRSLDIQSVAGLTLSPGPEGSETDPAHHTSVFEAIASSVSRLEASEQVAFTAASAFPATFTKEDFWSVCADEMTMEEAMFAIARLVEASLLVPEQSAGVRRYRMLEPLRDYGLAMMTVEDAGRLRDRHADWFYRSARSVAEAGMTSRESEALATVDDSISDYRVAMRHLLDSGRPEAAAGIAAGLHEWWVARFLAWEGFGWLEECLAHDMEDKDRLFTLNAAQAVAMYAMKLEEWQAYNTETIELSERLGDLRAKASALVCIGSAKANRGHTEEGLALFSDAARIFEGLGDEAGAARCRVNMGLFPASTGDSASARAILLGILDGPRTSEYPKIVSAVHRYLSLAAWHEGDESSAKHHVAEALRLAERANDMRMLAGALVQASMVEGRWGDPAEAARHTLRSLKLTGGRDGPPLFALNSHGAIPLLASRGEWSLVVRLLDHFNELYAGHGYAPHDRLNAIAPLYREEAARALADTGGVPGSTPVSTPEIASELLDRLTAIAAEG